MTAAQGHREAARRFGLTELPTFDPPEKPAKRGPADGRAEAARRFGTKAPTTQGELMNSKKLTEQPKPPFFHSSIEPGGPGGEQRPMLSQPPTALRDALHEIEGFTKADELMHTWGDVAAELTALVVADRPDPAAALAARYTESDGVTAGEVLRAGEAAVQRDQATDAALKAHESAGRILAADRSRIVAEGIQVVADSLTARFRSIIDDLRAAGIGSDDVDAKAAVDAHREDEHRQLTEAVEAYDDVRRSAAAFLNSHGRVGGDMSFWTCALLANVLDVDPLWGVRAAGMSAQIGRASCRERV